MQLDRDQIDLLVKGLVYVASVTNDPVAKILLALMLALMDEYERQTQVTP